MDEQTVNAGAETANPTEERTEGNLKGRIEAILFVTGEALQMAELAKALNVDMRVLKRTLKELKDEYDFGQRGLNLRIFGTHVQLTSRALYAEDVVHLLQPVQKGR